MDAALDLRTRCFQSSVVLRGEAADAGALGGLESALTTDCESVFDGRSTFWLAATRKPRCTLESFARDIFLEHTRGATFDPTRSGCEWWVQVRDEPSPAAVAAMHDLSVATGVVVAHRAMIFMHFDKDERRADVEGLHVHPQLSTVTYLANGGSPTLVFEHSRESAYDTDSDSESDADADDDGDGDNDEAAPTAAAPTAAAPTAAAPTTAVRRAWVSHPQQLKHLVFDGRLLHGVLPHFQVLPPNGGVRRTFLVNIWLNHVPLGASPLPAERLSAMSKLPIGLQFDRQDAAIVSVPVKSAEANELTVHFGPRGADWQCTFPWPRAVVPHVAAGSTVALSFSEAHPATVRRTPPAATLTEVPAVAWPVAWSTVQKLFATHQVLLIRGGVAGLAKPGPSHPRAALSALHAAFPQDMAAGWNIENGRGDHLTPAHLLGVAADQSPSPKRQRQRQQQLEAEDTWYVSTVVNGATAPALLAAALDAFGGSASPAFLPNAAHTDNLWMFFGANHGPGGLSGRPEHTDKISHSGTWHAQLAGSKTWHLRPDTSKAWPMGPLPAVRGTGPDGRLAVTVEHGDVLLVSTQNWFHSTVIPPTDAALDGLSFSVARDFYDLAWSAPAQRGGEVDMSNVADTWATSDIAKGTVISNDKALELPTDAHPNCAWRKRTGKRGKTLFSLIALRDIQEGESLTISSGTGPK